jgi:hypothetical protein
LDRKTILAIGLIAAGIFWMLRSHRAEKPMAPSPAIVTAPKTSAVKTAAPQAVNFAPTKTILPALAASPEIVATPRAKIIKVEESKGPRAKFSMPFVVEDGVAVAQGDIVLGVPVTDEASGEALMPAMRLWPTSEIPFYIQPNVPSPDRIRQALAYFDGTPIHFVELTNQTDAIVFEAANGTCKSYVGQMGGKQPLWIGATCGPHEIAHEVMHALGFVHEQNRDDRDPYLTLMPDNIEPEHIRNFEKLPPEFMKASGLGPFDYTSVMMYPKTMFARNGLPTMESKVQGQDFRPSEELSAGDRARLQKAYGISP